MDALDKAGVTYINLKKLFNEHKNDGYKLYWKTDSHWTDYGAFLAYRELFNHISTKFPAATPRTFEEFNWIEDYYVGGDVSYYLEYYDGTYRSNLPMKEYNVLRTPKFNMPSQIKNIKRYVSDKILTFNAANVQYWNLIDTNRPNLPSAVVMRDSYSTQMYDILAERFDVTCYKDMWSITTTPYDGERSSYLALVHVCRCRRRHRGR